MAINTLITIKDSLQLFVDQHQQLQRVVFGADDARAQLITESELFPMIYVAPVDVLVGRAHNTHRLRLYVYEKLNEDVSDFWENANDTSLMLRDIRVWWNDYNMDSDILISEDPTGQIKTDAELDGLVGYFAEILFQIPSHGRCDVPLSPVVHPPLPTCAPVTYNVEYANGDPIESGTEPSGGNIEVIVPNPDCPNPPNTGIYKSGQTILVLPSDAVRNLEGMGADWWNLDPAPQNANIFGHHKRFTGTTGGYQSEIDNLFYDKDGVLVADFAAAFPLGIIVDWSTRDWQNGKVLAYAMNDIPTNANRLAQDAYCEALTVGIYSNWKLSFLQEIMHICNIGLSPATSYVPISNFSLDTFFWVRDSADALTGVRIRPSVMSVASNSSLTTTSRALPTSYLTISGATLI